MDGDVDDDDDDRDGDNIDGGYGDGNDVTGTQQEDYVCYE